MIMLRMNVTEDDPRALNVLLAFSLGTKMGCLMMTHCLSGSRLNLSDKRQHA